MRKKGTKLSVGSECPEDQKPGLWYLREETSRGTYSKEELVVTLVGRMKDFKGILKEILSISCKRFQSWCSSIYGMDKHSLVN